jgi:SNF2 family DNA or RNA helicase
MGKTAQLIALMASRPSTLDPDTSERPHSGCYLGRANLVITPSHLCTQWKDEIRKFVGHDLKVVMATDLKQHMKVKFEDLLQADIVITSME